jgi:hypothetical protein
MALYTTRGNAMYLNTEGTMRAIFKPAQNLEVNRYACLHTTSQK